MKSTLWTLKAKDFFKGLILAVGTPILVLLQQLIPSWTPWLTAHFGNSGALIFQAGLSAFAAYLLKNLATDDTKEAVKTLTQQDATIITKNNRVINPTPEIKKGDFPEIK